jgi:hypothetical protein
MTAAPVKPAHKAIQTYYQTLKDYGEHYVGHETALRSAFQNLLADTARAHHWLLVPENKAPAHPVRARLPGLRGGGRGTGPAAPGL